MTQPSHDPRPDGTGRPSDQRPDEHRTSVRRDRDGQADAPAGDGASDDQHAHDNPSGWRARLRRTPGGAYLLKALVFVAGLACVLVGFVLVVLPGPLTIPPLLLGVYLWSTEFRWAYRLREKAEAQAREAWASAKAKPVTSALITGGGIVALVVGLYLVNRFELVARAKDLVGL